MALPLLSRAKEAAWLVWPQAIDITTEEGRAKERYRRLALTTLASVAARGIAVLTSLITVPLTLRYLGAERYGLWMTVSSIVVSLGFADLGIGNGLLNLVSEAHGKGNRLAAVRSVSSAFFMLLTIALICAVAFAAIYPQLAWASILNISSDIAQSEAGPTIAVLVGCFLVELPLSIVERVQRGYQEGFVSSLWLGMGNLLGLCGTLLVIRNEGGLPWLALAAAGPIPLATLLNALVLFFKQRAWIRPSLRFVTPATVTNLLRTGTLFVLLQVTAILAFSTDNIVIAKVLDVEAVTYYSVPQRLFGLVPILINMALLPLWPAYGEAIVRGDIAWVRRTFVRSLLLTLMCSIVAVVLLCLQGGRIVNLWVGDAVMPSSFLLIVLAIWTVIYSVAGAAGILLNAASALKVQIISTLLVALGAVALKVILTTLIGLPGIPMGIIISYTLFAALPFAFYIPSLLSRLDQ